MIAGEALAAGVAALGLDLEDAIQARLLAYLTLLEKWNRTHNLTSVRDPLAMVGQHLLDSLAVLPHLPGRARLRLIDVGSGGGLPGVPLAIARPGWQTTLLDSSQKKSAFLRQAAAELRLANVEVVTARAESYSPAQAFDVAIARALSDLAQFAAMAAHLLAPGGQLFAMKGSYPREEIAALPREVAVVSAHRLTIPGIEAERHLVIMQARPA
jgi:16S rRNA (guanine527-N7)-methyltransferase